MSDARTERREQERKNEKAYEFVKKAVLEAAAEVTDQSLRMHLVTSIEHLDKNPKPNNLASITLISICLDAYKRQEEDLARLMLYLAGTVIDEHLTKSVLNLIIQPRRVVHLQDPPLGAPPAPPTPPLPGPT